MVCTGWVWSPGVRAAGLWVLDLQSHNCEEDFILKGGQR